MNKVEPIRDQKKIEEIKTYLKNWNEKYYMMWLLGSNIGLRVVNGKPHVDWNER